MCTKIYITRGTLDNAAPVEKIEVLLHLQVSATQNLQHSNLLQPVTGEFHKETKLLHSAFHKVLLECLTVTTDFVHP